MTTKQEVASRSPGTCSESLWLLPSGPDQVHDAAMRGDPPLIGCACEAQSVDYRPSRSLRQANFAIRHCRCLPSHRAARARVAIIVRLAVRLVAPQRHSIDSAFVASLPRCPGGPCPGGRASRSFRSSAVRGPCRCRRASNELVVLVRPGPAFYFTGPDGALTGFDVDLARRFAAEKKLSLRFALADSAAQVISAIANEEAHIGAGGLYRPLALAARGIEGRAPGGERARHRRDCRRKCSGRPTSPPPNRCSSTTATATSPRTGARSAARPSRSSPTRVSRTKSTRCASRIRKSSGIRSRCRRWPGSSPRFRTAPSATRSSARSRRRSRATSISISMSRSRPAESATSPGRCRRASPICRKELDAFILRLRKDGTLARLADRYMPDPRQIQRIDAEMLQERIRTVLPQYRSLFHDGQEKSGIEWRLLAAIAYQESQWDPAATSATGVRGHHADHRGHRPAPRPQQSHGPGAERRRRGALLSRPQGEAAGAHPGARPHLARARGVQHRSRPPRGRAHPRPEAKAQPGLCGAT